MKQSSILWITSTHILRNVIVPSNLNYNIKLYNTRQCGCWAEQDINVQTSLRFRKKSLPRTPKTSAYLKPCSPFHSAFIPSPSLILSSNIRFKCCRKMVRLITTFRTSSQSPKWISRPITFPHVQISFRTAGLQLDDF